MRASRPAVAAIRSAVAALLPAVVVLSALAGLTACRSFPEDPGAGGPARPSAGAVVSEQPLATAAGVSVLDAGGNAIDAAVATALALAVVYPQAGNLGGGGFAVVAMPGEEAWTLDFREEAPAALTADAYLEDGEPVRARLLDSHLAAGVPGSPYGLHELHRRGGRLPFEEVAAPAIALARDGFAVDAWLARDLAAQEERLADHAYTASLFYADGGPPAEGEVLRNPDLARTLELLVSEGPEGFYRGEVADLVELEMRRGGGLIDRADLAGYRPVEREPVRGWFRGHEIVSMPPPSSGGIVLLQVLGVLDGRPLDADRARVREAAAAAGAEDPVGLGEAALHDWIEAMRGAFADRAEHMGDPDHWPVPVTELLDPDWIARRRIEIGERANPDVAAWVPPPPPEGGETTHLSVLDDEGGAVSLTTTLNTGFGNGIAVEGAGFLLNNEMDDFSVRPGVPNVYGLVGSEANAIRPGKRPLSSMTPTLVRDRDGVARVVIGSPGGPRIITSVLQVILRMLVYDQDLADAIAAPRLHQQWKPVSTRFEPGWDPAALEALEERGHTLDLREAGWSSVQGIRHGEGGEVEAVSDPRRGGAGQVQGRPMSTPARP